MIPFEHMKTFTDNLFLIDLDQPVTGFRQFISSWILVSEGRAVVIDPGPVSTINLVLQALKDLDIDALSAVLLTHIHIDHAGGVGDLLEQYPGTPVLCHPKGIPHMADPTRLWEGSVKVLGDLAHTYGPIKPVPEDLLFYDTSVSIDGFNFSIIETPGHASHHLSIVYEDILFAGEALGTFMPGKKLYLRMATPPVFSYNNFTESINRLDELNIKTVCFAHYGLRNKPEELYQTAREQLDRWIGIVEKAENREEAVEEILKNDPVVQTLESFPVDIREREKYFIGNSVRGIALSLGK